MSNKGNCTACRHTQAERIDAGLLAGVSMRALSRRYGLSRQSLARHKERHIPEQLKKASSRAVERREDGLLGTFEELVEDAHRLRRKAELAKDYGTALAGIREITRLMELAIAHQPKPKEKDFAVKVSFSTDGRVHVKKEPIGASPSPPIETTAAARPEPSAAPREPEIAPPARAAEPRRPAERPPHVCTSRCNTFTCSFKRDAADDAADPNDKWRFF